MSKLVPINFRFELQTLVPVTHPLTFLSECKNGMHDWGKEVFFFFELRTLLSSLNNVKHPNFWRKFCYGYVHRVHNKVKTFCEFIVSQTVTEK